MPQDLFSLARRVALITGGNPEKNAAAAAALGEAHAVFELDVRDEAAVEQTVAAVVERFGRLDILVNNAGLFIGGPVVEMTRETWDTVIGIHLTGSFLCAKHAAKAMVAQGDGGKIINIGSMYSVFGDADGVDYSAAKTGVLGLTRSLAAELAGASIQVNAILPGWIETDMNRGLPGSPRGENIRRKTPAARWGRREDMAGTAIFLASAASDFVTGTAIPVDGGYAISERFISED